MERTISITTESLIFSEQLQYTFLLRAVTIFVHALSSCTKQFFVVVLQLPILRGPQYLNLDDFATETQTINLTLLLWPFIRRCCARNNSDKEPRVVR